MATDQINMSIVGFLSGIIGMVINSLIRRYRKKRKKGICKLFKTELIDKRETKGIQIRKAQTIHDCIVFEFFNPENGRTVHSIYKKIA